MQFNFSKEQVFLEEKTGREWNEKWGFLKDFDKVSAAPLSAEVIKFFIRGPDLPGNRQKRGANGGRIQQEAEEAE